MDEINEATMKFIRENTDWDALIEHLGHDIRECDECLVHYIYAVTC